MPKKLFGFLVFVFLIKCLLASFIPLVADESYYYIWSLYPRLSYFDHPAMVSWLIYLGTLVVPFHDPLAVRFFFLLLGTGTIAIWLNLLNQKNASEKQQLIFLALFVLNPLLGIGSILATPDVPLVFFWSLSYFFFLKILENPQRRWYFLFGSSLGLGFCSKYHIVLFVIAGFVSLLFSKKFKQLRLEGILITIAVGLLFSSPVLIWNYQNQWASFLFQINHGFGRSYYDFEWTWGYLAGQALILSPLVLLSLFNLFSKSTDRVFSLSQILFFVTSTFKSVVEANWPIVAHPHAVSHFVIHADRKKVSWTFYYWLTVYGIILVALQTDSGKALIKNQYTTSDIQILEKVAQDFRPLFGPTYQISSLLSWQSGILVPKLKGFSRKDFFDELSVSLPVSKKFFVLKDPGVGWPEYLSTAKFQKLESFDNLNLELYQVSYD